LFPRWHAFFRQYRDPMQIVLVAAGTGSLYPLKQLGTGILLILLTLFNAVEGLHQEGKATAAVSALQKMVIIKARVRRDGQVTEIPAGQLVPGDIVAIDAGDIVPRGRAAAERGHAGSRRVRAGGSNPRQPSSRTPPAAAA
jgi:Ca2+-transporting ATPase